MLSSAMSSAPSTSRANCQDLSLLASQVFGNDLILSEILSNLTDMQDRITVEKSCRRLRNLSKRAPWRFRRPVNLMRITYYSLSDQVLVQVGDVKFVRPSLSLSGRRDPRSRMDAISQPQHFMNTLRGLADRFGKNVRSVCIGGCDDEIVVHQMGCQQLIITADFLRMLTNRFPNLEDITFRECGFDRDAVHYLHSQSDEIFPKLQSLFLSAVWCDSDAPPNMMMRLIKPNLQNLGIKFLRVEDMGEALMQRLSDGDCFLGHIDVSIANYFRSQPIDQQRYLRALGRRCGQITVRLEGEYRQPAPSVIGALLAAVELSNLVGLYVNHSPNGRFENHDFDEAMTRLGECHNLRELSLNGWTNPQIIKKLRNALLRAFQLEKLAVRYVSRYTTKEDLKDLLMCLPAGLEDLELSNIHVLDGDHMRILAKQTKTLRHMTLYAVPKVSSHAIEQCFRYWRKLETFHCDATLSPPALSHMADGQKMPKLRTADFRMLADRQPQHIMVQLAQSFYDVDCMNAGAPERLCRVRVVDRRARPLDYFPNMRHVHCDHRPEFHEPPRLAEWHENPVVAAPPVRQQRRSRQGRKKLDFEEFEL